MCIHDHHESFKVPIWDMDNEVNIIIDIEAVDDSFEETEQVHQNTGYIFTEHILFLSIHVLNFYPTKSCFRILILIQNLNQYLES